MPVGATSVRSDVSMSKGRTSVSVTTVSLTTRKDVGLFVKLMVSYRKLRQVSGRSERRSVRNEKWQKWEGKWSHERKSDRIERLWGKSERGCGIDVYIASEVQNKKHVKMAV